LARSTAFDRDEPRGARPTLARSTPARRLRSRATQKPRISPTDTVTAVTTHSLSQFLNI
jgi:hypothetical protein